MRGPASPRCSHPLTVVCMYIYLYATVNTLDTTNLTQATTPQRPQNHAQTSPRSLLDMSAVSVPSFCKPARWMLMATVPAPYQWTVANLPNQHHRKSVRKGFHFTVMVVGASRSAQLRCARRVLTWHPFPSMRVHNPPPFAIHRNTIQLQYHVLDLLTHNQANPD